MKFLHKLAASVLFVACVLSTQANAETSSVDENSDVYKIVNSYVKESVFGVSSDINIQLRKSMLSVTNHLSVGEEPLPIGTVTITDLVADAPEKPKAPTDVSETSESSV
jgi:hypothetical protein